MLVELLVHYLAEQERNDRFGIVFLVDIDVAVLVALGIRVDMQFLAATEDANWAHYSSLSGCY